MRNRHTTGSTLVTTMDQQLLLSRLPQSIVQHLPAQLQGSYQWHRRENQLQFLEHVEGLVLAHQYNLAQQIRLYGQQLFDLVTQDMAERVGDLVFDHLGYDAKLYHHTTYPLPKTFQQSIPRSNAYWYYMPLQDFGQQVPVAALRTMQLLDHKGIVAEQYWVAEKRAYRPLRDPLLCASFGRWVVSLAMWK